MKKLILLLPFLFLFGCDNVNENSVLDGSSDNALKTSVSQMLEKRTESEQKKFLHIYSNYAQKLLNEGKNKTELQQFFNGKTYAEILALEPELPTKP